MSANAKFDRIMRKLHDHDPYHRSWRQNLRTMKNANRAYAALLSITGPVRLYK